MYCISRTEIKDSRAYPAVSFCENLEDFMMEDEDWYIYKYDGNFNCIKESELYDEELIYKMMREMSEFDTVIVEELLKNDKDTYKEFIRAVYDYHKSGSRKTYILVPPCLKFNEMTEPFDLREMRTLADFWLSKKRLDVAEKMGYDGFEHEGDFFKCFVVNLAGKESNLKLVKTPSGRIEE